jgi:oligopeptide transport system substrate-binding protein
MNKVTWKMVSDATTYYQMYKTGELDLIATLPTDVIDQEKNNKDFKVIPYFGTYMFMLNVDKPPFTNTKIRRAFAMAIDRIRRLLKILRNPVKNRPMHLFHMELILRRAISVK